MTFLDRITDVIAKVIPEKGRKPSTSMSGGISGGHGMVAIDHDMIVSKPTIICHTSQIFFNFLAMACYASVASFQAKWHVGPSGLTGFAIFTSVAGMFLSAFMMFVPVIYEKHDKFVRLARALKEVRVGFILTGTGVTFSLLIAFIVTISAWTQAGCKNPDNDPHAEALGDDFKNGLSGWCGTKKAAAIFFWIVFVFWLASLIFLILDWRSGKLHAPRDPPFARPHQDDEAEYEDDTEQDTLSNHHPKPISATYDNSNTNAASPFADANRYSSPISPIGSSTVGGVGYVPPAHQPLPAGRASMDVYGAFSDPAPSGFGTASPGGYTTAPSVYATAPSGYTGSFVTASPGRSDNSPAVHPELDAPHVSRTMQYADPYAVVRASVSGQPSPPGALISPGYEGYAGGYR